MPAMNAQTRIIVATAAALAAIDIAVRLFVPARDVVSTRELRLVDSLGQTRAVLKVDRNGEPGLLMYDRTGRQRLQLDTFEQVPSLILMDESERRRVYFGMDENTGDGVYTTTDSQGSRTAFTGLQSFNVETYAPRVQVQTDEVRLDQLDADIR